MPVAERLGDGLGHFGLGLDHFGPALLDLGDHFLLLRPRPWPGGSSALARATRMSASAWSACKPGADVLAHVDVGDVDRDDLEGRLRVEPAGQHGLGNAVGILQHFAVCDSAEPMALTMPSPTRAMIVSSVAPPINCSQVGPHGDAGLDLQLDAVLGHGVERFAAASCGRGNRSPWDRRWSARLPARCGRPGRWPWPV